MAGPSFWGLRRSVAVLACLVIAAAVLTGSPAAGRAVRTPFTVLQLNICGSGIAGCYTGRSVAAAAAVIRAAAPDLVALNEVCRDDVSALGRTLRDVHRGDAGWAFKAATDRRTGGAFRCRSGQPYGIGLLAHVPARHHRPTTYSGIYPIQDTRDPEERAWLCLHTVGFDACTTHLASTSPAHALAQCRYLLDTAIPAVRTSAGYQPTVLAGDLNLTSGGAPDVRSCVPSGYLRADDGAVQQVVATNDFAVRSTTSIGMNGTTDHPGLLVALWPVAGARRVAASRTRRPEMR